MALAKCPNKNLPDYQFMVRLFGEDNALYLYDAFDEQIPTRYQIAQIYKRQHGDELSDTNNPEVWDIENNEGLIERWRTDENGKRIKVLNRYMYNTAKNKAEQLKDKYPQATFRLDKVSTNDRNNYRIRASVKFYKEDIKDSEYEQRNPNEVNYQLKAVNILLSDKAKQVFNKGAKNGWTLDKVLNEIGGFANYKQLFNQEDLGKRVSELNREQLALDIASKYSYTVEIETAIDIESTWDMRSEPTNAKYYSNLTVPGGTNYTENEISTPLITPSIKGHAQFSTDKGIGWFRSDEQVEGGNITKTRRILELQSDLFQKGRGKEDLIFKYNYEGKTYVEDKSLISRLNSNINPMYSSEDSKADPVLIDDVAYSFDDKGWYTNKYTDVSKENQFLQLLNKDNNWVTFFIKSIIQDSAKQTVTEVQESDVEAKVRELEKSRELEIDCSKVKAKNGIRSKFTKGSKWEIVKDLKGYPSHAQGGVDIKLGKDGFSFTGKDGIIKVAHGLVLPKIK